MQDDKRRRKFDQIERQTTLSDKIIEWANNIDNRINDRKERRAKRKQDRQSRRQARQEKKVKE
jgi:hypothetical protein